MQMNIHSFWNKVESKSEKTRIQIMISAVFWVQNEGVDGQGKVDCEVIGRERKENDNPCPTKTEAGRTSPYIKKELIWQSTDLIAY